MTRYFEAGVGTALCGEGLMMGRKAAAEALSRIRHFTPSLAFIFVSSKLDITKVARGVREVLGECPVIGTSSAGEIDGREIDGGVVVALLASKHLKVRVGMGTGVREDPTAATLKALDEAGVSNYFDPEHPLHQTLHLASPGMPGVSPVLLVLFTPGASRTQVSLSHDIHTYLRKASANRIPIFGGSSSDCFSFKSNYQICNDRISDDAAAIAFIESEILFGLGMAHGFSPTTRRALVTKASGHIVHELDGRPAREVCAKILGKTPEDLGEGSVLFSRYPFGATDIYGNSILQVPEKVLDDGSVQFAPIMRKDQVITLMQATDRDIMEAGLKAYEKALRQGGLRRPALALMFSCALRKRLMGKSSNHEVEMVAERARIPVCGYYTFGEQGLSEDGLPIYANQSVSTLVFSDELNPVASLIQRGKRVYQDFVERLDRKAFQIKGISRINLLIEEERDLHSLLKLLVEELTRMLPWADVAFYLSAQKENAFRLAVASSPKAFPGLLREKAIGENLVVKWLESHGRRFGILSLKQKDERIAPDEGDLELAETISKLTASKLHRIELDNRLDVKIRQLDFLNRLGSELSSAVSPGVQSHRMIHHTRKILKLSALSLWVMDSTHRLLIKEGFESEPGLEIGRIEIENDERLTRWQTDHCRPLFSARESGTDESVGLLTPFPYEFVSLPISYKGALRGVLNLYARSRDTWAFQDVFLSENIEFLKTISSQIGLFIENKSLHKHTTFYKEVHHRVKNNLQNIASLLRMQMRRLSNISPERALKDSINRIMSIAAVHEMLSHGEIGLVDLGQLLGRISRVALPEQQQGPIITLDISGPSVSIPSKAASTVSLVVNELLQNAIQHGIKNDGEGKVSIEIGEKEGLLRISVRDNGPGLPQGFDPARDGNLGLTIVRTLVNDELNGTFKISQPGGTQAEITFPIPGSYLSIK
ncbi:MAG: FIST C-terminal domain-containing protein [Deltaproteobacteria bacterium]|nr:FIST C-terminal domain-containing protein [Deltaproteobacteria bacterium]